VLRIEVTDAVTPQKADRDVIFRVTKPS